MDVAHCPAVIVVFAMEGCPACEEYKPRLEREIQRWQAARAPFVLAQPEQTFTAAQVPVILLDAQSSNPQIQALADAHAIEGLPTTILFKRNAYPRKFEGALDDAQIYDLLHDAVR